jgi:Spy/CpxP family protein refolding chaperone
MSQRKPADRSRLLRAVAAAVAAVGLLAASTAAAASASTQSVRADGEGDSPGRIGANHNQVLV